MPWFCIYFFCSGAIGVSTHCPAAESEAKSAILNQALVLGAAQRFESAALAFMLRLFLCV
jgi:hypothetical protein